MRLPNQRWASDISVISVDGTMALLGFTLAVREWIFGYSRRHCEGSGGRCPPLEGIGMLVQSMQRQHDQPLGARRVLGRELIHHVARRGWARQYTSDDLVRDESFLKHGIDCSMSARGHHPRYDNAVG